jgi:hypothetical protein
MQLDSESSESASEINAFKEKSRIKRDYQVVHIQFSYCFISCISCYLFWTKEVSM